MHAPFSRSLSLSALAITLAATPVASRRVGAQQPEAKPPEKQEEGPDVGDLAKTSQNPVGDLMAFPFQFNWQGAGGYGGQTLYNLNFQPVVPIKAGDRWTIISRTIVPYLNVPRGPGRVTGMGDIEEQTFLTPQKPGTIIWGAGPIFSFPTATNTAVATGNWGLGIDGVVLSMPGNWVVGALLTQTWTIAGDRAQPNVTDFLLQYFVNYNLPGGWALTSAPSITANWDAPSGQKWTVPFGGGFTRTTIIFGKQPISVGAQYYYNVVHPDAAAAWNLRFTVSLLFPTKKKK
ncbi:MAG TPA: hypothetical protein VEI06_11270 [Gemmatimonadaceae bacterium]|nr:hypothetical protein [Gemmatimonadaceae bacterium]